MITDCHIHIQPIKLFKPHALALIKGDRKNFDEIASYSDSPSAFLKYLDRCGVDRAVLINYVAPEVIGLTPEVNQFVGDYVKHDPKRLISCGGLHPRHSTNIMADVEHILRLGIRMIKIHPPHQLLFPNDYLNDVAVDFPKLKIILAHGGRPLWMDTAFFLLRRHANVYLELSGIPPKRLLTYFPRLNEIAHKTMFGTDWPSPGVADVKQNFEDFKALPISEEMRAKILSGTAASIWPE